MSQNEDLLLLRTDSIRTLKSFQKLLKLDTKIEHRDSMGLFDLYLVAPFSEDDKDLACLAATIFAEGFKAAEEDQKDVDSRTL